MSSKYNDTKRLMHSKGDHIQIMIGKKTDKVINPFSPGKIEKHIFEIRIILQIFNINN